MGPTAVSGWGARPMSKVIRTPQISEGRVSIGALRPGELIPLDVEEGGGGFVAVDDQVEEASAREVEEGAEGAEEADESLEEEGAAEDAGAGDDEEDPEEEPEAEEEAPQTFTALEVEALVEERLKAFEERFQTEKEAAYRSGYEDGQAEGLKAGQEQSRDEIEQFASIVQTFSAQQEDARKNADQDLVALALAVGRHIVGSATEVSEGPVLYAVRECLDSLEEKSRVVVKVHPDDLDVVRRHRGDWLEALEGIEQLTIEGDAEITRGGCILETPKGDVDAQIEERLDRLQVTLTEQIRDEDEPS